MGGFYIKLNRNASKKLSQRGKINRNAIKSFLERKNEQKCYKKPLILLTPHISNAKPPFEGGLGGRKTLNPTKVEIRVGGSGENAER